jgi:flavin reductase (DIM6/NTAB) family NADH-FMN oxidoreductase RutF
VKPARVARSPWAFECETLQVVRTNPGAPSGGNVVIGRVVHIHLADELADAKLRVDPEKLRAIARMGGFTYARTRERFELPPNRGALELPPPF